VSTATARTPGKAIPFILAALVVVSAIAVAYLTSQVIGDARTQHDQDEALAAARTGSVKVLSFDPKHVNEQLAEARTLISGAFAANFDQTASKYIVPAAQQGELSMKSEVLRAAVVGSPRPDQVDVLLLMKQVSSYKDHPDPKTGPNQVKITMTKSDGRWLISGMQPL
jgi:Mce-associated membrane protein